MQCYGGPLDGLVTDQAVPDGMCVILGCERKTYKADDNRSFAYFTGEPVTWRHSKSAKYRESGGRLLYVSSQT
jgi:hypothetical protein